MKKTILILVLVVALVGMVGLQALQISNLDNEATGSVSAGSESYEEMMARMHPDQAQATNTRYSQQSSGASMVGGC